MTDPTRPLPEDAETSATGRARRPWRMALPLLFVIALAAAWSGYWWFIFRQSQQEYARWMARAEASGMTVSCGALDWGGFPFRVEMSCAPMKLAWRGDAGAGEITLASLTSVTQVYNPQHVLASTGSPAAYRIGRDGAGASDVAIDASFAPATTSLVFDGRRPERISVLVEDVAADIAARTGAAGTEVTRINAGRLILHTRFAEPPRDGEAVIDVAGEGAGVRLDGGTLAAAAGGPLELDSFELAAQARGVPYPMDDPSETLRAFAAAGGALVISRLSAKSGPVTILSKGEIAFDMRGRANGELSADVVNLKGFLQRLQRAGRIGDTEIAIATSVLSMLEGATTGRPGSLRVDVIVKNGKIYFGPFEIAQLPPLF